MFNPVLFYESGRVRTQFVSTWKTDNLSTGSSTATQIMLPLMSTGTYNFVVDWGDGTSSIITSWNAAATTHTYSVAGTYTLKIKGTCTGWQFNNTGDRLKLLSILSWGRLELGTNEGFYFWGCINLNLTNVSDILDLSQTTSLNGMFRACTSLTTVNRINEWNLSTIEQSNQMFFNASSYNQELSINTSNFKDMGLMFQNATAFNRNIGNWNVSNVTNFLMFMAGKTPSTFSSANLDAIYNGWSSRPVQPNISISFGTAKYTAASSAGRAILTNAPNNWIITDGGI
jgi:surface protein